MASQRVGSSPDRKVANQQHRTSKGNKQLATQGGGNSRAALLLLLTSGFFITGLLFDYMPIIVDSQIKRTVELATNEEIQSIWSRPPVDLQSYYWLFDIQNHQQFMLGERAKVRKVGPFHFTSRLEKRIVEISRNKYRITYNSTRHIKFNESEQTEPLDEPLHLLNPLFVGMVESSRQFSAGMDEQGRQMTQVSVQRLASKYNESLVMKLSARQALIGRRVEMLVAARKLVNTLGLDMPLPAALDSNVFGYVAVQNNTWSGPLEVYTGYQASMNSLGDLISVSGRRRLSHYRGRCNRLQASAGELRPMPLIEAQSLEIFRSEFCRIVRLKPTGVHQLREGVAFGFTLAREDFASAQSNPDNRCFCVGKSPLVDSSSATNSSPSSLSQQLQVAPDGEDFCSLDGVIELAPCTMWTPLVLSVNGIPLDPKVTASLQDWDPELLSNDVDSLPPSNPLNQMLILKRLGIPVKVDLTVTMFMKVTRDSRLKETKSLPDVSYVPLVTVREVVSFPPNLAAIIITLEGFLALAQHLKLVMYLSAVVLLCWLTGHYFNRATRELRTSVQPAAPSGSSQRRASGASGSLASGRVKRAARMSSGAIREKELIESSSTIDTAVTRITGSDYDELAAEQEAAKKVVEPSSPGAQVMLNSSGGRANGKQRPALIFSKVDELRGLSSNAQPTLARQPAFAELVGQPPDYESPSTDDSPAIDSGLASSAVSDAAERVGVDEEEENRPSELELAGEQDGQLQDDEQDAAAAATTTGKRSSTFRRKNWFVQVYSNFVRMLTDIRTSISDASQLDVSANDYQDKQLELLAGRIDNWQRLSSSAEPTPQLTPDISAPPPPPAGAEYEQPGDDSLAGGEQQDPASSDRRLEEPEVRAKEHEEVRASGEDAPEAELPGGEEAGRMSSGESPESESVQSGQTVIQREDEGSAKARALEQLEQALGGVNVAPEVPERISALSKEEEEEPPKLMINNASGTDSPPELALHIAAGKSQSALAASLLSDDEPAEESLAKQLASPAGESAAASGKAFDESTLTAQSSSPMQEKPPSRTLSERPASNKTPTNLEAPDRRGGPADSPEATRIARQQQQQVASANSSSQGRKARQQWSETTTSGQQLELAN